MDPQKGRVSGRSGSITSLLVPCALLGAALLVPTALVAWIGFRFSGAVGLAAAAIAGLVCWVSGSLALAPAYVGQQLDQPIGGILGGMLFRMGLPLATGLLLQRQSEPLSEAGVFLMILGLYLVGLVVETTLSLRFVPPSYAARNKAVAGGAERG